jgi:DNA-binding transcriptional MerR regulator
MSSRAPTRPAGRMGIGEVLRRLRDEFPDVTISKIRFLEGEGLVEPQRSPSGYRKFSHADVEQLRYVLAAQRDHYLPLRVIKEHLDAIARGLEPPAAAGESPRAPQVQPRADTEPEGGTGSAGAELRLSAAELLANSGLTAGQLGDLQTYGLVRPVEGSEHFDHRALTIATSVAGLARHGLEPRHLRTVKTAADRQAGLIEQVVAPVARQRDADAAERAEAVRAELVTLMTQLHDTLVALALDAPARAEAVPAARG